MANYERINWEDYPSTDTPLDSENLNKMDAAIDAINREVQKAREDIEENADQVELAHNRIDTLIALPDGSTTADAELVDARIGYDNTQYNSLGAAIRGQVEDLDDASSQLNERIDVIETITTVTEETTVTTDILPSLTWTPGYMGLTGTTGASDNLRYSNKISVTKGDVITKIPKYSSGEFRYVTAFNGDTAISASGAVNILTYTVPEGVDGVVLTDYLPNGSYGSGAINKTTKVYTKKNKYDDDITDIQAELSGMDDVIDVTNYTAYEESDVTPTFTTGGINVDGSALSYTDFEYTQKIPVVAGDVIQALSNGTAKSMRWICAYNGTTAVSASGSSADANTYTVPTGIDGIVITTRKSADVDAIHITTHTPSKGVYVKPIPMGYMVQKGTLADGEMLNLPYHNCKINNRYVFFANIVTLSSVTFKKENDTYITVDNTNIVIHNNEGSYTVAHGLTIGSNIMLMVCNDTSYRFSLVRLASDGVIFDYTTATKFLMDENNPKIISTGSTLTDCVFSWVSENINAPIWVFGDSYLSWYDNRWTYYLAQDGYTKVCMLNGFAGQASATAYTALVNLLAITVPKKVVWCLGMNNADTNGAVNASWYEYYQRIIELQKKYGFELVLYTVPSTPTQDNSYKDAIIRASGYRYIEADKAVRIDDFGNWVTGALDSDEVHPTAIGAKILYCRILADLPELMSNN